MEPFIGQIMMFAGNFPPRNWAFCDGQLLPIAQNTALFSIMGTAFGGDGRTTFALPDLRGRVPIHPGHGPGLPTYSWGQRGGSNNIAVGNLPAHSHSFAVPSNSGAPDETVPTGRYPANSGEQDLYASASNGAMGPGTTSSTGNNSQYFIPYLGIYHIIALQGVFPSRS